MLSFNCCLNVNSFFVIYLNQNHCILICILPFGPFDYR
jgi:hypothetical protein